MLGEAIFHDTLNKPTKKPFTIKNLKAISMINPKFNHKLPDTEKISFVPMKNVSENGTLIANEEKYAKYKKGYTPFQRNDIILAKITPCFENKKITKASIPHKYGFGSTEFHVIRCSHVILPDFLMFFLRQEHINKLGQSQMTGSAGQKRIPTAFLNNLQIPLPPLAEQERFAARIAKLEALQEHHRQALAKQEMLFQSLQQRAFRGEL